MRLIDADELLRRYDEEHEGPPGKARKLIEEAPTACGWISVKDDLPKEFGEYCIVYNGSSVQYGDYYSNGEWYTPDCYESDEIRGVTHWMPLPEPPKEESNDLPFSVPGHVRYVGCGCRIEKGKAVWSGSDRRRDTGRKEKEYGCYECIVRNDSRNQGR